MIPRCVRAEFSKRPHQIVELTNAFVPLPMENSEWIRNIDWEAEIMMDDETRDKNVLNLSIRTERSPSPYLSGFMNDNPITPSIVDMYCSHEEEIPLADDNTSDDEGRNMIPPYHQRIPGAPKKSQATRLAKYEKEIMDDLLESKKSDAPDWKRVFSFRTVDIMCPEDPSVCFDDSEKENIPPVVEEAHTHRSDTSNSRVMTKRVKRAQFNRSPYHLRSSCDKNTCNI
jgi:hypothetical protein